MEFVGYGLMASAIFFYVTTWKTIWILVAESRQVKSTVSFNRIWWLPAWKVHCEAYPGSPLRKRIVQLFAVTFALMLAGMGFIARHTFQNLSSSRVGY